MTGWHSRALLSLAISLCIFKCHLSSPCPQEFPCPSGKKPHSYCLLPIMGRDYADFRFLLIKQGAFSLSGLVACGACHGYEGLFPSHASCRYRRTGDTLTVGMFGSPAEVWFTMHKLLWILKGLLPPFPFACFGYSRVFPWDLVNVLFPTTHASGIDSELFWAFPGICSRQKTCRRLQWSQPTRPRASHACAVSASSLGLAAPAICRPWGICFPPHLFLDWSAWVGSTTARTQISGALCM